MATNNTPTAFDKEQNCGVVRVLPNKVDGAKIEGNKFFSEILGMAEKEMEYRVDLFNRLTQTCFEKCIEKRYKESELNMGENSCIDRCVSKYWQVTNLIGQLLGSNRPPL